MGISFDPLNLRKAFLLKVKLLVRTYNRFAIALVLVSERRERARGAADKTAIHSVVDDNPDRRKVIQKILESAGYPVIEASSGKEALAVEV